MFVTLNSLPNACALLMSTIYIYIDRLPLDLTNWAQSTFRDLDFISKIKFVYEAAAAWIITTL